MGFFSNIKKDMESSRADNLFKRQLSKQGFEFDQTLFSHNNLTAIAVNSDATMIALGKYLSMQEIYQRVKETKLTALDVSWGIRIYEFKDVYGSEVVEDGNSITQTKRTDQISGALTGAVLFGPVGAVIGGLSGEKKNVNMVSALNFVVVVNDIKQPRFELPLIKTSTFKTDSIYKNAIDRANEFDALIKILVDKADKETSKATAIQSNSVADELTKLSKLLSDGHISKEEYDLLKSKLITA